MNKLFELIIFIAVVAVLWWALSTVLVALAVPAPWNTLAVVAFVVIAVFSFLDHYRSGTWFWSR